MALSDDARGPRFSTLVPVAGTPLPDVDPGQALRRAGRQFAPDWRPEALSWYEEFSKVVADHIAAQYAAEKRRILAEWTARFETGNSREADQFQAWLEYAIRAGNLETQLAVIAEVPYPPNWLRRYASYVKRHRDSTAELLTWYEASEPPRLQVVEEDGSVRPPRFADTGTFFWEER